MARGDYLGEFELVVMLGLARLEAEAYGMSIFEEIKEVTGRDLTIPAVYVTLNRLEKKGYLASVIGPPTPTRGGKAKRLYTVSDVGLRALRTSTRVIEQMRAGLEAQLADK